jgi:type III secretion protein W
MPTLDPPQVQERAFDLMKELVTITGEKWVGPSRFTVLADRRGLKEPAQRIVFLTGVKELMRTLPELVFEDPEIRQSILNAAQEALDAAIDLEED